MGLFDLLKRLFFGGPAAPASQPEVEAPQPEPRPVAPPSADSPARELTDRAHSPEKAVTAVTSHPNRRRGRSQTRREPITLDPLLYQPSLVPSPAEQEVVDSRPYRFANIGPQHGEFLDLSQDGDQRWLDYYGLPELHTPDHLASWLNLPIGQLAWLTHRTARRFRPETEPRSHYIYRWLPKRSGGWRLLEVPKPKLKSVQQQILREILDRVPAHPSAHGFVSGRSILSNAAPHVGQRFILKFDLTDFYANVRYSRVVAIFRSLGYSREVALWLARLTTSALPWNVRSPMKEVELTRYASRHLPQGAATSPALANLSAYGLDVRLSGLARCYGLKYTRYADDLTFSGPGRAIPALHELIPLIRKIIRSERFFINRSKTRILRDGQRQTVTGVVVNEHLNVSRAEFDRLKAILHNCVRSGPSTQNREAHPNFADHLRGRIAHVLQINPARGQKLMEIYDRIDWNR